ncbi:hypothetical protein CAEBREN_16249 [Caenorhabditis brenneri]|uniref:Uncharacterized protein n=1 Tax=Caenorhabditis brenneri TaxID=135651 RepID=G0MU47_CAEBE|nr:hypothetical protein CAEBREN_16249 [Caenorhabditis brenneri]
MSAQDYTHRSSSPENNAQISLNFPVKMDHYEMHAYFLASVIRTGHDANITLATEAFNVLPANEDQTKAIDKANLPFLIDCFAPNNKAACQLIQAHRQVKRTEMAEELSSVLDAFRQSVMMKYAEKVVPKEISHVLINMLQVPHPAYIQQAVMILIDLEFGREVYEDLLDNYQELCVGCPEGNILIQKAQVKLASGATKFTVQSQEKFDFDDVAKEVLMKLFVGFIQSGDQLRINYAIDLFKKFQFPLELYKKYEVAALIFARARHCQSAMDLLHNIHLQDNIIMADELVKIEEFVPKYAAKARRL